MSVRDSREDERATGAAAGRAARTGPGTGGSSSGTRPARGSGSRSRGRPRSEAVERAIVEGLLTLVEEGCSLADLSVERIARAAGVGKATIYRRWPGRDALLVDVLATLEDVPAPELTGARVRDDLVAILESVRRRGVTKRDCALLRLVTIEVLHHPSLAQRYRSLVVDRRREALYAVLRRGVERGELRADLDLDLLAELFVGPLMVRTVLHEWAPLDEGLPARIVDAVLDGVRVR